jgi:hypothetical protein
MKLVKYRVKSLYRKEKIPYCILTRYTCDYLLIWNLYNMKYWESSSYKHFTTIKAQQQILRGDSFLIVHYPCSNLHFIHELNFIIIFIDIKLISVLWYCVTTWIGDQNFKFMPYSLVLCCIRLDSGYKHCSY